MQLTATRQMRVIMIASAITTISSFSFVFCFKSNSFPGSTLFPYRTSRREPWERGWLRFNLEPLDLVCSAVKFTLAFQLYHLDISCKYAIIAPRKKNPQQVLLFRTLNISSLISPFHYSGIPPFRDLGYPTGKCCSVAFI